MIKSLFDHDDEPKPQPPPRETRETEDAIRRELEQMNLAADHEEKESESDREVRQIFSKIIELPPPRQEEPKIVAEPVEEFAPEIEPAAAAPSVRNQPFAPTDETVTQTPLIQIFAHHHAEQPPADASPAEKFTPPAHEPPSIFQTAEPQSLSTAETLRQSGLAWSAAIGLFGSVVFMLLIGWIFDVLTGAAPLGIIAGIVIGAAIGFYQFFRVTSQIFKK